MKKKQPKQDARNVYARAYYNQHKNERLLAAKKCKLKKAVEKAQAKVKDIEAKLLAAKLELANAKLAFKEIEGRQAGLKRKR